MKTMKQIYDEKTFYKTKFDETNSVKCIRQNEIRVISKKTFKEGIMVLSGEFDIVD